MEENSAEAPKPELRPQGGQEKPGWCRPEDAWSYRGEKEAERTAQCGLEREREHGDFSWNKGVFSYRKFLKFILK